MHRYLTSWLAPVFAATVLANHAAAESSVFTALGIEPATLGNAWAHSLPQTSAYFFPWQVDSDPDPFALVVLPTTPVERQQFLAAMMATPLALTTRQRVFVAQLLEGWGQAETALAMLEAARDPNLDPLHLVRLRFFHGDLDGAAAAFKQAQDQAEPESPDLRSTYRRSAALIRPLVALDHYPELARLLEWLQPRCQRVEFRAEILKLRLNVAWHTGKSAELLAKLSSESVVLRQAADWLMTRDPAKLPVALADLSAGDLLLICYLAPGVAELNEALRQKIASNSGSVGERAELLVYLVGSSSTATKEMLEEWLAQGESCLPVLAAAMDSLAAPESKPLPVQLIAPLADQYPDDLPLNLLAGLAVRKSINFSSDADPTTIDPAERFFHRAMRTPLLTVEAGELESAGSFLPQTQPDIAGRAIAALAEKADPQDLLEQLTAHPDFARLSAREQARYLAIAKLDVPFLERMIALDWNDPAADRCGGWLARYLATLTDRLPAGEVWNRMVTVIPAMLMGSKEKSKTQIEIDAVALGRQMARFAPADSTCANVIRSLCDQSGGTDPQAAPQRTWADWQDPILILNWFTPARLMRWVDVALASPVTYNAVVSGFYPGTEIQPLIPRYPAVTDRTYGTAVPKPEELEVIWKLRRLIPDNSPHAIACDAAIAIGHSPNPPQDLAAIAKRHLAAVLDAPQELDFILLKVFTKEPKKLRDWAPLAALAGAPAVTRKQAATILDQATRTHLRLPQHVEIRRKLWDDMPSPFAAMPAQPPAPNPQASKPAPDPYAVAMQRAEAALTGNDLDGLLVALTTLRHTNPTQFLEVLARAESVALLPSEAAPRLLEIFAQPAQPNAWIKTPSNLGLVQTSARQLSALHQFFNDAGPQFGAQFRSLILATDGFRPDAILPSLVNDLIEADRKADAVELLAKLLATSGSPVQRGANLRFPATPRLPFHWPRTHSSTCTTILSTKLSGEVLDALPAAPATVIPADLIAILRYAAAPSDDAFLKLIAPLLADKESLGRDVILRILEALLKPVPGEESRLRLLDEIGPQPTHPDAMAWQASRSQDPARLRDLWQKMRAIEPILNERALGLLIGPMAHFADDALWAEYSSAAVAALPSARNLTELTLQLQGLARPSLKARLSPILQAAISALPRATNLLNDVRQTARAAWLLDDSASLDALAGQLRKLPEKQATDEMKSLLAEIRLYHGDPEAAFPLVWARPGPNGQWEVVWSLAGLPQNAQEPRSSLGCNLAALDGWFDLAILGSSDGSRFTQLTTLVAAKASGAITLSLPEGTTTVSLIATHPATKTVIQSAPLKLATAALPPFDYKPPVVASDLDFRKLPAPFGNDLPAIGIKLAAGESVEIATLPWQPGQSIKLGAWVLTSSTAALQVQPFDGNGKPLTPQPFARSGYFDALPHWNFASLELDPKVAAVAEKLVLTATNPTDSRRPSQASTVWFSDVRLETLAAKPLPVGTQLVGRLLGGTLTLSCDATGARVAATSREGQLVVLEAATGMVRRFDLGQDPQQSLIGIGGGRVIVVDALHVIRSVDLASGKTRKLGRIKLPATEGMLTPMGLSPDGEWLVWNGPGRDVLVAHLGNERLGKPLSIPCGENPEFVIDRSENTLLCSGSNGHFSVPISAFANLESAPPVPLAEKPQPCSAFQPGTRRREPWLDPIHGLSLYGPSGALVYRANERMLQVPGNAFTVSAQGIIFYATTDGLAYRIDPAAVQAEKPASE